MFVFFGLIHLPDISENRKNGICMKEIKEANIYKMLPYPQLPSSCLRMGSHGTRIFMRLKIYQITDE